MLIANKSFNKANTYNATSNGPTDGKAVFTLDNLSDVTVKNCLIDGEDLEWGCKISRCWNVTFENCTFSGGTERAVDCVRGGEIAFIGCHWISSPYRPRNRSRFDLSKRTDAGFKASVRDVNFEKCSIQDVLLGDYSLYDQIDRPKTRRVTFEDCGSVIVRCRHATAPTFTRTEGKSLVWPGFVKSIYWKWNRLFGDKSKPMGWDQIEENEKI